MFPAGGEARNPFETRLERVSGPIEPKKGVYAASYTMTYLSPDEHSYWVAAYEALQDGYEVHWASQLTSYPLECGAFVRWHQSASCGVASEAVRAFGDAAAREPEPFLILDAGAIEELSRVSAKFRQHDHGALDLSTRVQNYLRLNALPNRELRTLGYFSMLESLLTHAPQPHDPTDSIGRQIQGKMVLLGHRFDRPLQYDSLDVGIKPKTAWSKLYGYRSSLAHGGTPDFESDFRCLQNASVAEGFVRRALVSVMRQALEEPQLVIDLKGC
jgi:hypothetical protein